MDKWETTTIGALGQVFDGPHATPKTISEGPIFLGIGALQDGRINLGETRHVTPHDFEKWTRRVRPHAGDFVFSYETRLGEAAIIPEGMECCLGRRMGLVRVDQNKILPRFFLYKYISPEFQEFLRSRTVHGATVDRILLTEFPEFPFPCPPLDDQQAIVSLLGALDDKIELNQRMNDTLEATARAIFRDWFVDIGPTRAKVEGRAPYLALELWDLFPDRVDDENVPAGWRVGTVGDFFRLTMGQSPPGCTYNESGKGMPFFQGRTDFGLRYPENRKYCTRPTRIAELDDTLVSVRAPVGELNMAWEKCCVGRGVASLRHKSGSRSYTYYSAWGIQRELKAYEHTGTVFGSINKKQFRALSVVEPAREMISAYETLIWPFDQRIRMNVSESRALAQTRDFLLPRLMSGEIRLREAEKAVQGAA